MALIKRYANRKLYHVEAARYITLEEIAQLVRQGEEVRVLDHASGRDLSGVVLLQALMEEEKRLGELLPRVVLTRLLQDGEESFFSLRSRLLAAFDPEQLFESELRRRFERLTRLGEMSAAEGERLLERLLAAEPATPADGAGLEELQRQVAALEKELEALRAG